MTPLRRAGIAIVLLGIALFASNAFWYAVVVDQSISADHRGVSLDDHRMALKQLRALAPVAARADATPAQVVRAATDAAAAGESFEKEGYTWIGALGLRFDAAGRLVEVRPAWE